MSAAGRQQFTGPRAEEEWRWGEYSHMLTTASRRPSCWPS